MLRGIMVVAAVLVAGMLALHMVLSNGALIQFLDTHPDSRWVPTADYCLGEGYYIFQNLPEAATYFIRVPERYPKAPLAEDAYAGYLQCLDDTLGISREVLMAEDQKYLDRFPNGAHAAQIKERMDVLRTGAR